MASEVDDPATLKDGSTVATPAVARPMAPLRLAGEAERYTPDGELGRGGMGIVSAQVDHRIGRRVACKELRPEAARDQGLRARFLREARVQGQLEHPAIVPVYDVGERDDGTAYFTMKTVAGATLHEIITQLARGDGDAQQRYPRHRLLAAFSRICLAVDYAHGKHVLHRDLKPANLILGEYGEGYVLDWGLAKVVEPPARRAGELTGPYGEFDPEAAPDTTSANAMLGTPGYMAPEQVDDAASVGPTADVYALGTILFELLAHEPLHPRGLAALASTRAGADARLSVRAPGCDAPPELERAVVVATAQHPAARGTARALSDAIERYLEGERDLELHRARADDHLRIARQAVAATSPGPRRDAIQHALRACVLDPSNPTAFATLADLLRTVPSPRPAELAAAFERKQIAELHMMARVGATLYALFAGFLAIMLWMGVREPATLALMFGPLAIAAVVAFAATRIARPGRWMIVLAMGASTFGLAMAIRVLSPLIMIPGALATNTMGYALFVDRRLRALITIIALAAFVVPVALELGGVTPSTFTVDGRVVIYPAALDLPRLPTLVLIVASSLSCILMSSVLVGYFRDRLTAVEDDLHARNWLLDGLVPPELRRSPERPPPS
jgi:serine/threonine protein kinase